MADFANGLLSVTFRNTPTRGADHVVGVFHREGLSSALAATHRAGFGPQARVIDGARGDVWQQLARAGLRVRESDLPPTDGVLIVVTAPGRVAIVADLFVQLGAEWVVLAERRGDDRLGEESAATSAPDIRIRDEAERGADA